MLNLLPEEKKKIAVLYNSVDAVKFGEKKEVLADDDNLVAAKNVQSALTSLGHEVTLYNINNKTFRLLDNLKTDVIFNLMEGLGDLPNSMYPVISFIESLDIPYTGADPFSSMITTDKARTKVYLERNKIPTPDFQLFINTDEELKYNLRYPLITKANTADASVSITQSAVVKNFNELKDRIELVREEYRDATLAESYVEGRELEVMAIKVGDDLTIFPVYEVTFLEGSDRKWDIRDFDAKWIDDKFIGEICPSQLDQSVSDQIEEIMLKIYKVFNIRSYCRVDFRLSKDNIPYVVDVNVNPGLSLYGEQKNMLHLEARGVSYEEFCQMIVDAAIIDFQHKQEEVVDQPQTSEQNIKNND